MASRMDRYYKGQQRSTKNRSLYDQINSMGNYSNIEGVLDISNANEIDINEIKELIDETNNKKNTISLKSMDNDEENIREEKTYDIKDVLDKAKTHHNDKDSRHRNLKRKQYEILKKLKIEQPENEKIDELLNTLALSDSMSDDLGIFDDLKSNTMVGEEASSIKKVLDEAKSVEEKETQPIIDDEVEDNDSELDKSFYTASFNFSNKDFAGLKSIDTALKKNNKLIKILIIVFSTLIAIVVLIVIGKLIF